MYQIYRLFLYELLMSVVSMFANTLVSYINTGVVHNLCFLKAVAVTATSDLGTSTKQSMTFYFQMNLVP